AALLRHHFILNLPTLEQAGQCRAKRAKARPIEQRDGLLKVFVERVNALRPTDHQQAENHVCHMAPSPFNITLSNIRAKKKCSPRKELPCLGLSTPQPSTPR